MRTGSPDTPATGPGCECERPVADVLAGLLERGIEFVLLRDPDLESPRGDVDVLLRSHDLVEAEECLAARGWLRVPAAGHGSHVFYVTYSRGRAAWFAIDLVTSLDMGPTQAFRTDLAEPCLVRRVVDDRGLPVLQPDDAFWLLFLHLAWKRPSSERNEKLRVLAGKAAPEGPVADCVASLLRGGTKATHAALAAARGGDWDVVRTSQVELRRRWRLSKPLVVPANHVRNWIRRRVPRAEVAGLSVAFLGLDGAGKTTVTSTLVAALPWPTVSLYMGVWRTSRTDRLLGGVPGARLALRLGRLIRIGLEIRYHRSLGRLVLLDRYIIDATLPSSELDWKGRVSAVLVLRTAAAPDRLILLDAPPEVVFARKGELTLEELRQRRLFYVDLSDLYPQWETIDVDRPLEEVLVDVNELLWADLINRHHSASAVPD